MSFKEEIKTLTYAPFHRRSVADQGVIVAERERRLSSLPKARIDMGPTFLVVDGMKYDVKEERTTYTVTLTHNNRTLTTTYTMGAAFLSPPSFAEVIDSLLSDVRGIEGMTFEQWCDEYGADSDSRAQERIFNACRDLMPRVRMFLGGEYDTLSSMDEDQIREHFKGAFSARL